MSEQEYRQHIHDAAIVSKKEKGPKTVSLNQVRLPYDIGYVAPEKPAESKQEAVESPAIQDDEAPRRGRPKKNAESD